jgi:hypothetical protein
MSTDCICSSHVVTADRSCEQRGVFFLKGTTNTPPFEQVLSRLQIMSADSFVTGRSLVDAAKQASDMFAVTPDTALEEFRRWIQLKVETRDEDATFLGPTPLVDFMWHAAILDTVAYAALQKEVGMTIHHRPASLNPTPEEETQATQRRQRFANVYRIRFQEATPDSADMVRFFADKFRGCSKANTPSVAVPPALPTPTLFIAVEPTLPTPPTRSPTEMQIFVKDLTARTHTLNVEPGTLISMLRLLIHAATGVTPDHQRIVWAGQQIEDSEFHTHKPHTLASYNIQRESTLHLVLRLC